MSVTTYDCRGEAGEERARALFVCCVFEKKSPKKSLAATLAPRGIACAKRTVSSTRNP